MITTVTTTTISLAALTGGSLVVIVVAALVLLLIQKEIVSSLGNDVAKRLGQVLNVSLIPFFLVFVITAIFKVIDGLR